MNFSQLLLILHARLKIIALTVALTALVALSISLILPKTYKATATLVLNYKGVDPVSGFILPSQLMPGYMATQVDIINSMSTALQVVEQLKLAEESEVKEKFAKATKGKGEIREWLAAMLLQKLDVAPSRESSVLNISFSSPSPQYSATVVNAFADAYQHTSIRLKSSPSKKAAHYFNDQIKLLRDNLETAQEKLSKYQQENGIVSMDRRLDVESSRLNELSTQLVAVQGQLMEAASRRRQAMSGNGAESPDVIANPLIQNLKAQLVQAELKLTSLGETLTADHPHFQAAKAEVDKLHLELNRQIKTAANGIANNARILQQRESDLRTALDEQKSKVLELNRKQDELKVLSNEVESAQRAYETATQRFAQANLEGQANLSDIGVLNPALPPLLPAAPKLMFNLMLALFLGALFGVGFAMLAELRDRRVRSGDDLIDALQAPVLGVITWGVPERPRSKLPLLLSPRRLLAN